MSLNVPRCPFKYAAEESVICFPQEININEIKMFYKDINQNNDNTEHEKEAFRGLWTLSLVLEDIATKNVGNKIDSSPVRIDRNDKEGD
ncbi:hypothetical protein ACFLUZ_06660 [Chloroflexota bacterium]